MAKSPRDSISCGAAFRTRLLIHYPFSYLLAVGDCPSYGCSLRAITSVTCSPLFLVEVHPLTSTTSEPKWRQPRWIWPRLADFCSNRAGLLLQLAKVLIAAVANDARIRVQAEEPSVKLPPCAFVGRAGSNSSCQGCRHPLRSCLITSLMVGPSSCISVIIRWFRTFPAVLRISPRSRRVEKIRSKSSFFTPDTIWWISHLQRSS